MKKLVMTLAVGALSLSMASMSSATDVNVYGSSAAYNFWSKLMTVYASHAGCGTPTTYSMDTTASCSGSAAFCDNNPTGVYFHGTKYFIATASGCNTNIVPDGTLTMRLAAYDSQDGVNAMQGTTNPADVNGCTGNQRTMLKSTTPTAPASNNLGCYPIHLGGSDVNGVTLIQNSQGSFDGGATDLTQNTAGTPKEAAGTYGLTLGGKTINADLGNFTAGTASGVDYFLTQTATANTNGMIDNHPWVLPFAFYANVTPVTKTSGGTDSLANELAGYCIQSTSGAGKNNTSWCPNALSTAVGNETGTTPGAIALTQGMVEQIFSQAVTDWSQIFTNWPSTPITLCLRVAGSGTYATLDAAVMSTNKNSSGLPTLDSVQYYNQNGYPNNVWFNNTTGDMANCILNNPGAIGIMDASQGGSAQTAALNGTFGPLKFNGNYPTAANVANGLYDRFWTLEHIFQWDGKSTKPVNWGSAYPSKTVTDMMSFVNNMTPAQFTGYSQLSSYTSFWNLSTNMNQNKGNDFTFPPAVGPYVNGQSYE